MSRYRFYVDVVSGSHIYGWASLVDNDKHRVQISVFVNGAYGGSTECDVFRSDLFDAKIGDGCYGFSLGLSQSLDIDSDNVILSLDGISNYQIVQVNGEIKTNVINNETAFSDILRHSVITTQKTNLYLDVTDLLFYWSHHRRVSGIQRVQLGYVNYILRNETAKFKPIFCFKMVPGDTFFTVSSNELMKLININSDASCPDSRWDQELRSLLASPRTATKFSGNGLFAILGAPWVSPEYYEVISSIKSKTGIAVVQIIYDLIPILRPDFCDKNLVSSFTEFAIQCFIIADFFLAISEHTKREVESYMSRLGLPPKPVHVVPMGTELTLHVTSDEEVSPRVKALLKKDYVLFVSTIEARKNHRFILELWRSMITRLGPDRVPRLVFVGRRGWLVEDLFNQLEASQWLNHHVVHLQNMSDHELELLYKGCQFTVFPSWYEGWGLPVTESLRYGKPCVAAANSSITEAGGTFATYIDLGDNRHALETVTDLVLDHEKRHALADRIRREFSVLTWDEASRVLLDRLEEFADAFKGREMTTVSFANGEVECVAECIPVLPLSRDILFGHGNERKLALGIDVTNVMRRYFCFGPDWHPIEPWGRWVNGQSMRLLIAVANTGLSGDLAMHLGICLPDFVGPSTIQVCIGGNLKGEFSLRATGGEELVRLNIAAKDLASAGNLSFIALELIGPAKQPPNDNDCRLLGLGLMRLMLVRADDLEARINYLESGMGMKKIIESTLPH